MATQEHIVPTDNEPTLRYQELSDRTQGPAIVFLHGAHSSSDEWDLVTPYLKDRYHMILPDLPAHGRSSHIGPFSKLPSVQLLADLIRWKVRDGKAHVVGHSMGAQIAIDLASEHPDLIGTVFVSGYPVFSSPRTLAYGLWIQNNATAALPTSIVRWLTDDTDLQNSGNNSLALSKAIASSLSFGKDGWPSSWPARTLIIAAGKSGILPTADNTTDAKRLRDIGRLGNEATTAYTHSEMRHPWNRQDPKLYAQTIIEWFEKSTVPAGFKQL